MFLKVIILGLAVSVCAVSVQNLFDAYAGPDHVMNAKEFKDFWYHFDDNDDGNVTKMEFDLGWKEAGLQHQHNSPMFFVEIDRVPDEVLNEADFIHLFTVFEGSDGDGLLDWNEFHDVWEGLFKVSLGNRSSQIGTLDKIKKSLLRISL